MPRMSMSMCVDAVRDRSKTVTRRHVDTWKNLRTGDRLTLIEKGMGLRKGEHQVVLAEAEVLDVRVEPLHLVDDDDLIAEGFPEMLPYEFVRFWLDGHGYGRLEARSDVMAVQCRRIEFRYLDVPAGEAS